MSYLSALRPSERRLVVVVGSVFFVVLNLWLVVPHFSDWGKTEKRLDKSRQTLALFQKKIHLIPTFERRIRGMEDAGGSVPVEDQAMHFASGVQQQAVNSGVSIIQTGKILTRTNQFFIEQQQPLSLLAREQQLVDFLYNLGEGTSSIRVRDLALRADATHQQLNANIKLVASYLKKPPVRGSSTAKPAATSAKPAATTPKPATVTPKAPPTTQPGPSKAPVLPGPKPVPGTGGNKPP